MLVIVNRGLTPTAIACRPCRGCICAPDENSSIPQVALIVFDPMPVKERAVLLLICPRAMVLALIFDVNGHIGDARDRAVPTKQLLPAPKIGCAFDDSQRVLGRFNCQPGLGRAWQKRRAIQARRVSAPSELRRMMRLGFIRKSCKGVRRS